MILRKAVTALLCAASLAAIPVNQTLAASDPFLGEIMWVPYNFCPRGWANADGQLLAISQNSALFSLLGTTYGGDGRTTFGLPNLRGRVSVHTDGGGTGSGYPLGSIGGAEEVTLTAGQLPSHNHAVNASADASDKNAAGSILGSPKKKIYDAPLSASTTLAGTAIGNTGGDQPHENRPPYLTLRACIATVGIFPSRN